MRASAHWSRSVRAAALGARLQAMLGEGVGVGWAAIGAADGLFPAEAEAMARAVPDRRAEFAAGRRAARMALAAVGLPEVEIPVGPRRAPVWPEGVSGSITHDRGVALAAVITNGGAIGIDLTEAVPLPAELRDTVLPHRDEAALTGWEARVAFSAKESFFKALYPSVETLFGFEAALFVPRRGGRFMLRLVDEFGSFPAATSLHVEVASAGEDLLTSLLFTND